MPDTDQAKALDQLLRTANKACNWLSECAWESKEFGQYNLHKARYAEARELFGLPAQVAVRCISKVADAYKLDKKVQRTFRPLGSIAFDDRNLTWHVEKRTVSIGTLAGRIKIAFAAGERQLRLLASRQGESDLIFHRGKWFLTATCNVEQPTAYGVDDFLGIDLGVSNIAYLAGHFDGEGCIRMGRRKGGTYRLRISVNASYFPTLDLYAERFGGNIRPSLSGTHKPMRIWELDGIDECFNCLNHLQPLLREKREQAIAAIEYLNARRALPRSGVSLPSLAELSEKTFHILKSAKTNRPNAAVGFQPTDPQSYRLSAG